MALRMNKKRNSGLVYEFLVRRLGTQMVERDTDGAKKTVTITEKYFSEGKPLAEELALFTAVRDTRGVTAETARRILGEVGRRAGQLDVRTLDIKKSNLIKELNYAFGRDFFDRHRLPEYRLFGAIQMYIDGKRGRRISESVTAIQLEDGLVRWMTSRPQKETRDVDGRVDALVCTMAQRRFNEKYGESLNSGQKSLLEAYVRSLVTEDLSSLRKKLEADRGRIGRLLVDSYRLDDVQKDQVMKGRYVEATRRLAGMDVSVADEHTVEEMMLFHKLAEEIQSDE